MAQLKMMNKSCKYLVVKSLALIGMLGLSCGPVSAEIMGSYSADLSDAFELQDASVRPGELFIFESTGDASTIRCCEWVSGPGSSDRFGIVEDNVGSGGYLQADLTDIPPNSVRQLTQQINGQNRQIQFSVSRLKGVALTQLTSSGPVDVTENGQIVENLKIVTGESDACAIRINQKNNVVIRNVEISHKNVGICVISSDDVTIQRVKVVNSAAPATGPHCVFGVSICNGVSGNDGSRKDRANADSRLNIQVKESQNIRIEHAYLEKGGAGIQLNRSHNSKLNDIQCFDARGPYPRGNCVQWSNSDDGTLKNFYIRNIKDVSHDLDVVNLYYADNVTVSHGLLDGNFSRNGIAIIADAGSDNATVEHVDFVRIGGGATNVYASDPNLVGKNFTVRNVRVKDTVCVGRDNLAPSSGGLAYSIHPAAINPRIENAIYWNHCRASAAWCVSDSCRVAAGGVFDIREQEFELKAPLILQFDWEASAPKIISIELRQ